MKRKIAIVSAIVSFAMMNMTAYAASPITSTGGTDKADVKGTYYKENVATVYSVDIQWGSMEFTYTDTFKGTWNPETHKYENPVEAGWKATSNGGNKITVTNHSNAAINAGLSYKAATGHTDVTVGFTATDNVSAAAITKLSLDTADNGTDGEAGTPTSAEAYVQIKAGKLSSSDSNVKLGTVTITMTDAV